MDQQPDQGVASGQSGENPTKLAPSWWNLVRETGLSWWKDECMRLGAALAYYAVFAASPLLVLAVLLVGMFYGQDAAEGHVASELEGMMTPEAAQSVQSLIAGAEQDPSNLWTIVSLVVALFAASAAVAELRNALNTIWKVRPKPSASWRHAVQDRLLAFGLVLFVGTLFLAIMVLTSITQAAWGRLEAYLPFSSSAAGWINYAVTLVVVTVLFAIIFRFLPHATIAWSDVWMGALVTAGLFGLGNVLIGIYFSYSAVASAYGAAGSVLIFLLWAYYSALIVYLGAEFTQVYARMYGSKIRPESHAEVYGQRKQYVGR
jgi:membrane protein